MICPLSTIIFQKHPVNLVFYLNCQNRPILPRPVNATTALHQHRSMFFQCSPSPIQRLTLIPQERKLALFPKPRLSPPRFTQRTGCASPVPEILHQTQTTSKRSYTSVTLQFHPAHEAHFKYFPNQENSTDVQEKRAGISNSFCGNQIVLHSEIHVWIRTYCIVCERRGEPPHLRCGGVVGLRTIQEVI